MLQEVTRLGRGEEDELLRMRQLTFNSGTVGTSATLYSTRS